MGKSGNSALLGLSRSRIKHTVPPRPSKRLNGESGVRASLLNVSVSKKSANLDALYKYFESFVMR